MSNVCVHCRVGRLHWGRVRDAVRYAQFQGHPVEIFEGTGIFTRVFTIRGPEKDIRIIEAYLKKVCGREEDDS
jgi:hypothetical protein